VVAVPVTSSERVVAVARAASSANEVRGRVWGTWAAMAVVALLAGVCASLIAAVQSRRLARPLQQLEAVAEDLGAGDFTSRAEPSGVGEIDRTGRALNRTARRLDDMVARERAFTERASHQLRTPLTRLRLGLETGLQDNGDLRGAARDAILSADQLSRTIDDVLAVSRGTREGGEELDVAALLADLRSRWNPTLTAAGRSLTVADRPHLPTEASVPAVRQILEVLLDNAYRHGRGGVTVTARDGGGAVAIDVVDEGKAAGDRPLVPVLVDGVPAVGESQRLGLRMASSLADGVGGRLLHAHTEARTRMTVLLPARPD
jgi:signal transduction histidine kinase